MNENQSRNNIGEEIKYALEDALRTGNFRHLNDVISDTVWGTLNNVKERITDKGREWENTAYGQQNNAQNMGNTTPDWENKSYSEEAASGQTNTSWQSNAASGQTNTSWQSNAASGWTNTSWQSNMSGKSNTASEWTEPDSQQKTDVMRAIKVPFKRVGRISGTLYQVFGGIGTGVMAILSIIFMGPALWIGGGFSVAFGILVFSLIVFIAMINIGCMQKGRLKRAEKYRELSGDKHYIDLKDLALHTNKPVKYIVRDVKRMLRRGFFPEGHLDIQESCLMLDEKVYKEYISAELWRQVKLAEQNNEEWKKEKEKAEKKTTSDNSELDSMIAEGQEYIRRLREMNDNIKGEVISRKLFRLQHLLKEIFDSLKEHPDQVSQMKKFMSYYLPTTVKLVDAYEEFDSLSVQGDDIQEAKSEIEKTLDTINDAFGELLNKFFREAAYDVTADAQVLQAMLAKEGLSGDMEQNRRKYE